MSTSDSAACELSVKAARSASTSEFAVSAGSVKAAAYASISAACRLYAYYAIVSADASKLIHGDNTDTHGIAGDSGCNVPQIIKG